jgi:hypothetical protein
VHFSIGHCRASWQLQDRPKLCAFSNISSGHDAVFVRELHSAWRVSPLNDTDFWRRQCGYPGLLGQQRLLFGA